MDINEQDAVRNIKLLKPRHGDIFVFSLHRKPTPEDTQTVMRILRQTPAQVLIFLLGPGDSVAEIGSDEDLKKEGLMRIPRPAPVNEDKFDERKR